MNYMYIMQFILSIIGMSLLGYYIAYRTRPDDQQLRTVLTAIGMGLGVFVGFVTLIKMIRNEERYERSSRH